MRITIEELRKKLEGINARKIKEVHEYDIGEMLSYLDSVIDDIEEDYDKLEEYVVDLEDENEYLKDELYSY